MRRTEKNPRKIKTKHLTYFANLEPLNIILENVKNLCSRVNFAKFQTCHKEYFIKRFRAAVAVVVDEAGAFVPGHYHGANGSLPIRHHTFGTLVVSRDKSLVGSLDEALRTIPNLSFLGLDMAHLANSCLL